MDSELFPFLVLASDSLLAALWSPSLCVAPCTSDKEEDKTSMKHAAATRCRVVIWGLPFHTKQSLCLPKGLLAQPVGMAQVERENHQLQQELAAAQTELTQSALDGKRREESQE